MYLNYADVALCRRTIQDESSYTVLLPKPMFVITVVKMLLTHNAQLTNIVVDMSTDHAKPLSICFLILQY